MIILILFAFFGGIITILSPCILPVLPIVLSGTVTGGKKRPLGVITGFIISFSFFTLFLASIVRATGLSADVLRFVAAFVIGFSGLSLLIPALRTITETLLFNVSRLTPKQNTGEGYLSGIVIGMSLGLLWTPCVGPILASIITLAATSSVGLSAIIITLSYAFGTAIPLFAVMTGGRTLLNNHPWLSAHTAALQKGFGVLMLLTAIAIYNSWDRNVSTYMLKAFPNYGAGLTKLEDNALVRTQLQTFKKGGTMILNSDYGNAPDFIAGGQWFNSEPLTIDALRGKVVLVDFWTYTCINCIRTLPYIKAWHEKYKDRGLVIVGVHTPEFEFEKNSVNVKKALGDFGITYPVVQDNDYATWQAYANHYWPAKYLVDKNGRIRYTHFGEGEYDQTETRIQQLLSEMGTAVNIPIVNPAYQVQTRTPETYLGKARGDYSRITTSGTLSQSEEFTNPLQGASLTYRFDATEVFLVMRPKTPGAKAKIKVTLDGKDAGEFAGSDVINGVVTVDSDRLYKLIKLPAIGTHILKLEFLDGNAELYAFTFG